jgi:predicted secreted protein
VAIQIPFRSATRILDWYSRLRQLVSRVKKRPPVRAVLFNIMTSYLLMLSFFILSFDIILSLDILPLDIPVVLFFCIAPPGSGEPLLLESLVEGIDDEGFEDVVGVCANAPTVAKAEIAAAQLVIIIAFRMIFLRFEMLRPMP